MLCSSKIFRSFVFSDFHLPFYEFALNVSDRKCNCHYCFCSSFRSASISVVLMFETLNLYLSECLFHIYLHMYNFFNHHRNHYYHYHYFHYHYFHYFPNYYSPNYYYYYYHFPLPLPVSLPYSFPFSFSQYPISFFAS